MTVANIETIGSSGYLLALALFIFHIGVDKKQVLTLMN